MKILLSVVRQWMSYKISWKYLSTRQHFVSVGTCWVRLKDTFLEICMAKRGERSCWQAYHSEANAVSGRSQRLTNENTLNIQSHYARILLMLSFDIVACAMSSSPSLTAHLYVMWCLCFVVVDAVAIAVGPKHHLSNARCDRSLHVRFAIETCTENSIPHAMYSKAERVCKEHISHIGQILLWFSLSLSLDLYVVLFSFLFFGLVWYCFVTFQTSSTSGPFSCLRQFSHIPHTEQIELELRKSTEFRERGTQFKRISRLACFYCFTLELSCRNKEQHSIVERNDDVSRVSLKLIVCSNKTWLVCDDWNILAFVQWPPKFDEI